MAEREVLRLEPLDVAQHLVLGVVTAENIRREELTAPRMRRSDFGDGRWETGDGKLRGLVEAAQNGLHFLHGRGLVERDADLVFVDHPQIDPLGGGGGVDADRGDVAHREGVEHRLGVHLRADRDEALRKERGETADAAGNLPQAIGPVVHGVHRGHHREQHLRGADVRRGLVAADVLLARAEGETERGVALRVLRDTDEAPGHLPLEGVLGREETGMRPAEAERHAKTLGGPDRHIGAKLTRRAQEREGQQVGRGDGERPGGVRRGKELREIVDRARGVGILHQHAEAFRAGLEGPVVADHDLDAERQRAGADDVDGLRMAALGDEEHPVCRGFAFF